MRENKNLFISLIAGLLVIGGVILAGEITNTSAPAVTGYTLDDIYNKLTDPEYAGTSKTNLYPSVTTGTNTMRSLTDIWDAIPSYKTLDGSTTTVEAGIYGDTTLSNVDTDLSPDKIKQGATIFGVSGSFNCVPVE